MPVTTYKTCKVCNSKLRNYIERLATQGFTPELIYEHLMTTSEKTMEIVTQDKIVPSNIRKHIQRHFNEQQLEKVNIISNKQKIEEARESYYQGRAKTINKINLINLQIDTALTKMESLDNLKDIKLQHDFTIKYMTTIKGLVETLNKLTENLKDENIDVQFFGDEITKFADLVLVTIRRVDKELQMNGKLEEIFAQQFVEAWKEYINLQNQKLNNEVPLDYGNYQVNTFNETDL